MADVIATALAEDIGSGDVTVEFFIDPAQTARARIFAKEAAVVAGASVAAEVFARVDPGLAVHVERSDGTDVAVGETVLTVQGRAGAILTAERVALNFLQQLSGVATLTRRFVDLVQGTPARILDTRKTVPGLRILQKAAVLAGGGLNHRMGLYDMAMVKDNHLLVQPGALQAAIDRLHAQRPSVLIELEADQLEQVRRFVALRGVAVILLDNMAPDAMREAVALGQGTGIQFEASGGVTLETVRAVAESGVGRISVGALTHSARAIDFSLEFLPDDFPVAASLTKTAIIGRNITVVAETGSTNDLAAQAGRDGAAEGAVIFAEAQRAGRGRLDRRWISPPGLGLLVSILLRPSLPFTNWSQLTFCAALAVANTVEAFTDASVEIKWPNDVLASGKKIAGILLETHQHPTPFVVIGIGLNVLHLADDFPPELRENVTSLQMQNSSPANRRAVAAHLLARMDELYCEWQHDFASIRAECKVRGCVID